MGETSKISHVRDKKHLKIFHLKRLQSSLNVTMFLKRFNLEYDIKYSKTIYDYVLTLSLKGLCTITQVMLIAYL